MRKNIFYLFIFTQLFYAASNFSVLFCMGQDETIVPEALQAFTQQENMQQAAGVEMSQDIQIDQTLVELSGVEQLQVEIENIDKQESELLNQLKQMSAELDSAINESVSARKLKNEMINVENERIAEENLKKLKESLKKTKEIYDKIRIEFARTFEIAVAKIETAIKRVKEKAKSLEKKGVAARKIDLPEEEVMEIQKVIEEESAKSIAAQESYFFNSAVKVVAFIIGSVRGVGNWFARVFSQAAAEDKNKIKVPKAVQNDIEISEPVKPVMDSTIVEDESFMQMAPPVQAETLPKDSGLQTVADDLKELQTSINQLEQEKQKISQKREKLEEIKKKRLDQIRKKFELMSELELEVINEDAKPKWRKAAEYVFALFLDTVSFVFKKIKQYSILFYQNFLKAKIRRFVISVQDRVEEIEKTEDGVSESIISEDIIMPAQLDPSMGMKPSESIGMEEQDTPAEGMGMQNSMETPEEMPPQPSAQEMTGAPPTTSGMGMDA